MSRTNEEVVRAAYDAFNQRDFDAALAFAHDSITWKPFFAVDADIFKGKEEILAAFKRQIEALDATIEISELTALDETRVLVVGTWRGRGSGSGIPVEQAAAQVFTVSEGLIRSVETYATRAAALDAVGQSA
jgi:ketosteroid isomerase-like protein